MGWFKEWVHRPDHVAETPKKETISENPTEQHFFGEFEKPAEPAAETVTETAPEEHAA